MFLDSHCHLIDKAFDEDREAVIQRAREAGLHLMLTIACNPQEARLCLELADAHDDIYVAAALHPHEAADFSEEGLSLLRQMMSHPRMIGFGEIGLDFYYDTSPRQVQEQVFRTMLREAIRADKPVIIHLRDPKDGGREATARFRQILAEEDPQGQVRGIMHCYTGPLEFALEMHERGFLISLPGILTFKKLDEVRAMAAGLPQEAVMVETDSPYLAPVPHRGRRNEPAFVVETALVLAQARGMDADELDAVILKNFKNLFQLT